MRTHPITFVCLMVGVLSASEVAVAQQAEEFHPYFTRDFEIGVGAFFMAKELKLRVNGSDRGDLIDLEEVARLDNNEITGALDFRWHFGDKWSFEAQGWKVSDSGGAVLTEDIHWEDVVFEEGTFAEAGLDVTIARLFFGRKFWQRPNQEFGAGVGAHWMEIDAFLQGQILTNLGDTEVYRGNVGADVPLPNIGAWYNWSWSPRWMLKARLDWLSARIGDYSGGLLDGQVGVNWQVFRNVGIGFFVNGFTLDVNVKKESWKGGAKTEQIGPLLTLTASW